jgi:deoxyribonuclease V
LYTTPLNIRWPRDRSKVKEAEERLGRKVRLLPPVKDPAFVAGADAAFFGNKVIGAVCLYTYPGLEPIEEAYSIKELTFPYIPGYLSFREGPAMIEAIGRLKRTPDVVIFDGQGIAHPRGLGLASFAGLMLDIPTIGCAKSRLVGTYKEPGAKKGSHRPLSYGTRIVGAVVRTRGNTKAVFVSPGHMMDVETSVRIVLGCATRYRLAEPVRSADILTKRLKKAFLEKALS